MTLMRDHGVRLLEEGGMIVAEEMAGVADLAVII